MKKATRTRIILCLILLIIGLIWGYLLATHQHQKRINRDFFPHRPTIDTLFEDPFEEIEREHNKMNTMFDDLEKDFFKEKKHFNQGTKNEFRKLEINSWNNSQSKWSFQFYQKTSKNWEDSSYELNWNWQEWEGTWTMIIKWINKDWKEFEFSGTMQNWKSEWILIDEDWNTKTVSFDDINIDDIYKNSNHITD